MKPLFGVVLCQLARPTLQDCQRELLKGQSIWLLVGHVSHREHFTFKPFHCLDL